MKNSIKLPLLITDADGRILYKSRAVNTAGFLPIVEKALAKGKQSGLVICNGKSCYMSRVSLSGKDYIFFTDCEKISESFEEYSMELSNELFDLGVIASDKRKITLEMLTRIFADACRMALLDEGVRITVHKMARDIPVCVSPRAFVLALALMARLACAEGDIVDFSTVYEYGRVTVECNSIGGKSRKPLSKEMFEILLYEASVNGGFEVERVVSNGKINYVLRLVPADAAFIGLKAPVSEKESYIYAAYISMFL